MPAGPRIRGNNVFGTIFDNPLLVGDLSFTSLGLQNLPVVSSAHAVVVFDPKRLFGAPEIVVVTNHTAMATTATITRGQYGTVAREHPQGTPWAHVPIDEDYIEVLTSSTRPGNPFEGQMIYETDLDRFTFWDGASWLAINQSARMGWHVTRVANQLITTGAPANISWDTEIQDTPNNFTAPSTTLTIPAGGDGLWMISYQISFGIASDYNIVTSTIVAGGITFQAMDSDDATWVLAPQILLTCMVPLVATNTIVATIRHNNAASQNVTGRLLAYKIGN